MRYLSFEKDWISILIFHIKVFEPFGGLRFHINHNPYLLAIIRHMSYSRHFVGPLLLSFVHFKNLVFSKFSRRIFE
ncbi:hypothetical protein Hanom_Chr17g01526441 [Helianthus anomalus]